MTSLLVIVLGGIAAVVSMFLSKPEKPRLAYASAAIIAITTLWQGATAYQEKERDAIREEYAIRELERSTHNFVEMLRDAIYYSSDGWLPSDQEEFFSERSAVLLSEHLNLESDAPVLPNRSWRKHLIQQGRAYQASLQAAIDRDADVFDSGFLEEIVGVLRSALLNVYMQSIAVRPKVDREIGIQRAPVWLGGGSGADQMHSDLLALKSLVIRLRKNGSFPKEQWRILSMASDNRWPKHLIGNSRFPPRPSVE